MRAGTGRVPLPPTTSPGARGTGRHGGHGTSAGCLGCPGDLGEQGMSPRGGQRGRHSPGWLAEAVPSRARTRSRQGCMAGLGTPAPSGTLGRCRVPGHSLPPLGPSPQPLAPPVPPTSLVPHCHPRATLCPGHPVPPCPPHSMSPWHPRATRSSSRDTHPGPQPRQLETEPTPLSLSPAPHLGLGGLCPLQAGWLCPLSPLYG